jgi:protease I
VSSKGFVKHFVESGKPVAAICRGPWTLVRNAGAEVVDQEVVIDGQITTSRSPKDLPAFCPAIVEQFAKGTGQAAPRPAAARA